ncbi:uncharacterized protein A4U43_C02F15090 [Asparagus officinalis]|uniref:Uncharacterized protein n=1 Tax=Asparagus officinalis TaxID=4686 RepID=A0A5P1FL62_ASPOF|nr:uncharacterized protein A4U43_C02F15090 [Asparagus officinalis]
MNLDVISPLPAHVSTVAASCGMTTEAIGKWSSLVGANRAGVLVSPRSSTLEQVDPLTEVTMHTGEEEEAPVHEKMPSQREDEPIPEEAPTQEGEAPILGEASASMIIMASSPTSITVELTAKEMVSSSAGTSMIVVAP